MRSYAKMAKEKQQEAEEAEARLATLRAVIQAVCAKDEEARQRRPFPPAPERERQLADAEERAMELEEQGDYDVDVDLEYDYDSYDMVVDDDSGDDAASGSDEPDDVSTETWHHEEARRHFPGFFADMPAELLERIVAPDVLVWCSLAMLSRGMLARMLPRLHVRALQTAHSTADCHSVHLRALPEHCSFAYRLGRDASDALFKWHLDAFTSALLHQPDVQVRHAANDREPPVVRNLILGALAATPPNRTRVRYVVEKVSAVCGVAQLPLAAYLAPALFDEWRVDLRRLYHDDQLRPDYVQAARAVLTARMADRLVAGEWLVRECIDLALAAGTYVPLAELTPVAKIADWWQRERKAQGGRGPNIGLLLDCIMVPLGMETSGEALYQTILRLNGHAAKQLRAAGHLAPPSLSSPAPATAHDVADALATAATWAQH